MTNQQPPKKKSSGCGGLLVDLFIDFTLIGLGLVLYYQFFVKAIFPVTISPALTEPVGGMTNAAYIMCGLPLIVGTYSLIRTLYKFFKRSAKKS